MLSYVELSLIHYLNIRHNYCYYKKIEYQTLLQFRLILRLI